MVLRGGATGLSVYFIMSECTDIENMKWCNYFYFSFIVQVALHLLTS